MSLPTDCPLVAADVCRGTGRLLALQGYVVLPELVLPNQRRVDLMGLSAAGDLLAVEVKVSQADLLGDGKWRDYLPYCDRFTWAVPPNLAGLVEGDPERIAGAGVIVADRYGAGWRHEPPAMPAVAGSRRKALLISFARQAAWRLLRTADPDGYRDAAADFSAGYP